MAYKVFTNGSVLNASEINDNLMRQSVMVFSNSTARSAAITSPVEGMVTYLEDSKSLQLFNGTSWGSAIPVTSGNAIINGAFEINQRNYVSGSNLALGVYGFDRWKSNFTNTTLTFTSAPQGQQITINSGGGIQQVIEQANIPAGTYTLSWSGTATGRVYNSGATPPSYAASPVTVTLDGSANVVVEFTASGSTKTLSKVQFESGASATPFRRNSDSRAGELEACLRYFAPLGSGAVGRVTASSSAQVFLTFPTRMRTIPTLSFGGSFVAVEVNVAARTITSISLEAASDSGAGVNLISSGMTLPNMVAITNSNNLLFSAEL